MDTAILAIAITDVRQAQNLLTLALEQESELKAFSAAMILDRVATAIFADCDPHNKNEETKFGPKGEIL